MSVLTYLYNQPKLTHFVIQGLVTLFARITKLGWFDSKEEEFVFRDVIQDVTKFLQVLISRIECKFTYKFAIFDDDGGLIDFTRYLHRN